MARLGAIGFPGIGHIKQHRWSRYCANVIESALRIGAAEARQATLRFMGARHMGLGHELGERNAGKNEQSAGRWSQAHPLAGEEE